jgi:predicted enzyme related to lactoylglutathione lyase
LSVTNAKSFHYVELTAESIERASSFYSSVFGWVFAPPPPEHGATDVAYFDGVPEVGLRLRGRAVPNGGIRPAVAVESIEATLALVEQAGGRVVQPSRDLGDGYTGFFEDSEGNVIGLWAFK